MKLQRFFVGEKITDEDLKLQNEALIHQIRNVFRKEIGDQIVLLDNSGFEFLTEISELQKKEINLKILEKNFAKNMPIKNVTFFCSLIKKDNFELMVEKCTEIGVTKIVPLLTERSEKKSINRERLLKIIKEASEQSERGVMTILGETKTLDDALTALSTEEIGYSYMLHTENPKQASLDKLVINNCNSIKIFIGPEGGWSNNEIQYFQQYEVKHLTLGHQILRAETAAIAIASLIVF